MFFHIERIDDHDGKDLLTTITSIVGNSTIVGTTITYFLPCTTMTMVDPPIISSYKLKFTSTTPLNIKCVFETTKCLK
jgi:hypothetical protein